MAWNERRSPDGSPPPQRSGRSEALGDASFILTRLPLYLYSCSMAILFWLGPIVAGALIGYFVFPGGAAGLVMGGLAGIGFFVLLALFGIPLP